MTGAGHEPDVSGFALHGDDGGGPDDSVGANRHRRAGEDAVRTVPVQAPRGFTSGSAPSHLQTGAWLQVGTAHGIAVHRGLDEAGKIKTRFEGRGDDTPHASSQRHIFNTQLLRAEAQDAGQRDIEREYPPLCSRMRGGSRS